jgi:hypothetical protein
MSEIEDLIEKRNKLFNDIAIELIRMIQCNSKLLEENIKLFEENKKLHDEINKTKTG